MHRSGFVTRYGPSLLSPASLEDLTEPEVEHRDDDDANDAGNSSANAISLADFTVNALKELTRESDINEAFDLKKRLYETREAFHGKVPEVEHTDDEVEELKLHVKKGQEMLKTEIHRYSRLKDQLDQTTEIEQVFHDNVIATKRTLIVMEELKVEHQGYVESLHAIHDLLDDLNQKITHDFAEKTAVIKEAYEKSFNSLLRLRDIYQVCRNSDISHVCPTCIQSQVECFMVPCGHTFCKKCVSPTLNPRKICHMCRKPYSQICNLFYS